MKRQGVAAFARMMTSAGAVLFLTSSPVWPAGGGGDVGCMYEAIEYDVLWDDIWHGGDDPQPVYHPDCDVQPGPDECEWSEPEARGEFDLYHARWEPGYLYAEHTYVRPCEGGN